MTLFYFGCCSGRQLVVHHCGGIWGVRGHLRLWKVNSDKRSALQGGLVALKGLKGDHKGIHGTSAWIWQVHKCLYRCLGKPTLLTYAPENYSYYTSSKGLSVWRDREKHWMDMGCRLVPWWQTSLPVISQHPFSICNFHPFSKLCLSASPEQLPARLHTVQLTAGTALSFISHLRIVNFLVEHQLRCCSLLLLLSVLYQILFRFYLLCIMTTQPYSSVHHSVASLPFSSVTHSSLFTSWVYSLVGVKLVWKYSCCWCVDTYLGCTINPAPWPLNNNKKQLDSAQSSSRLTVKFLVTALMFVEKVRSLTVAFECILYLNLIPCKHLNSKVKCFLVFKICFITCEISVLL